MMDHVGGRLSVPSKGGPPPPFIVTRRGGAHEWGRGSRRFPPNRGVQWSDTVGSTLWEGGVRRSRPGYRPWSCEDRAGRPVKIVPVVLPAPAGGVVVADVWSSIYGAVAFGGPYGLGSCMHQHQW